MSFTAMNFEDYCRMEAMGREPISITRALPKVADVRALLLPAQSEGFADAMVTWVIGEAAKRYANVQHHSEWTALVAHDAAFILAGASTPQADEAERMRRDILPAWSSGPRVDDLERPAE